MKTNIIYNEDCIEGMKNIPNNSINTCITSPPYWGLRDYGVEGQLGLEDTPEKYVNRLVNIFLEVKRVLKDDGTLWLNLGDSYFNKQNNNRNGLTNSLSGNTRGGGKYKTQKRNSGRLNLKQKDLVGIPWRVAFALQEDGWYIRNDIIWHKPNPMPESVKDRCTTSHEHIFLLSKSKQYYYNQDAIRELHTSKDNPPGNKKVVIKGRIGSNNWRPKPENAFPEGGRNKRDVWKVNTKPFPEAHFAVYPPDLIRPCIRAGCPDNGIVLDPFMGAGTTALVALQENKKFVGIELNKEYINIAYKRIGKLDKFYYNYLPEKEKPAQLQMF